jgi:hypothetical protein
MNQQEKLTWISIENGPPEQEGPYFVTRSHGRFRGVIMENWSSASYEDGSGRWITTFPQWDGDPRHGGAKDGVAPEEGPVIAWAKMPRGYLPL